MQHLAHLDMLVEMLDAGSCLVEHWCRIGLHTRVDLIQVSETNALQIGACYACRSQIGIHTQHGQQRSTNCWSFTLPYGETSCWSAVILSPSFWLLLHGACTKYIITKKRKKTFRIQNVQVMLMSRIRQASKPACCAYKRGLHANKTTSVTFIIDWFLVGFGLHRWPCCGPCAVAGVVVLSLFDPLRRLPSPVTVSPATVHFIE